MLFLRDKTVLDAVKVILRMMFFIFVIEDKILNSIQILNIINIVST